MKKTKRVRFRVTALDIAKGCKMDTKKCPIARSLMRHSFRTVYVSNYHIRLNGKRYTLPEKATQFIHEFDSYLSNYGRDNVQPFNFYLTIRE